MQETKNLENDKLHVSDLSKHRFLTIGWYMALWLPTACLFKATALRRLWVFIVGTTVSWHKATLWKLHYRGCRQFVPAHQSYADIVKPCLLATSLLAINPQSTLYRVHVQCTSAKSMQKYRNNHQESLSFSAALNAPCNYSNMALICRFVRFRFHRQCQDRTISIFWLLCNTSINVKMFLIISIEDFTWVRALADIYINIYMVLL